MLRTLALGGSMGQLTPKGLLNLAPLTYLTTLVLVQMPGMNSMSSAASQHRRGVPPGGVPLLGRAHEDVYLPEGDLVRFLDHHPVLKDWCGPVGTKQTSSVYTFTFVTLLHKQHIQHTTYTA